ncbi:MAG: GDP-L-fucose synthase [Armatimonadota bacterium]|nr:GDP-L-fucose synthase [Armatimonadota bacterium]
MTSVDSWHGMSVVVTGGGGFLGRVLVDRLRRAGARVCVPRRAEYDLTDATAAARLFAEANPEVVFHLAAAVGGIGANRDNPGRFFYENMAMGLNVLEQARRHGGVRKLVLVSTTCAYPEDAEVPLREEDLWRGYPEPTNAPYGIAKRALVVMAHAYLQQYGLRSITLIPANLYGPGDNFDLETSHVIPALIRKCVEAVERGDDEITVWGDGTATREFLYVDDAARGLLLAAERYDDPHPVNLGTGEEISIKGLVTLVADLTGFRGLVRWDTSKPTGQRRRRLEISRAWEKFGFRAAVSLREGLQATISWYRTEGRRLQARSRRPGTRY